MACRAAGGDQVGSGLTRPGKGELIRYAGGALRVLAGGDGVGPWAGGEIEIPPTHWKESGEWW
jgi:hypothetical protein